MIPGDQFIRILFLNCLQDTIDLVLKETGKEAIKLEHYSLSTGKFSEKIFRLINPHIVVADSTSTQTNIPDIIKKTRAYSFCTPVIVLADSKNEHLALEFIKAGAGDYVLKRQLKRMPFAILNSIRNYKNCLQAQETREKLEKNEIIYEAIIENSTNAVFLIRNQIFEKINSEFERIFEYSFKDVSRPGFSFLNLVASECKAMVDESYRRMEEAGSIKQRFEFTAVTKSGIKKEVDASVTCNMIRGDFVIQGIIRDITHGKFIEKSLFESEKKFRTLFYNHSAVKLIIDPGSGKILDANKAAAAFYGWPVEKLQQMNVAEINFLPPQEVSKRKDMVDYPQNVFSELRHLNSKGQIIDVEIFSSKIDYEGKDVLHFIIHDITARKKAEQKLHLLNHAVEQNPVAIVITDPEGRIEYVNPEFTSMTGFTLDEAVGKSPRILNSGYQSAEFYRNFWKTITSGKSWEGEFRNKKKNGEIYWQESSISPILDENGLITHYVAVLENITDKKQMFEDLVRAKEKAEESDRLKSAFLANMSHEIRTPMNGIIGFTDLLKEQKLTGNEKDKYINIIKKSGERMLNTINDLIEISQIESKTMDVDKDDVNVNDLMNSFYHQFKAEADSKGLKLSFHKGLPDSNALIESDGKKLNAIFSNLIKNAIKYTFAGGIDYGYKVKDNLIEFYVKDTGIGIEPGRHEVIFDRFVQADMSLTKPYEGAGLGLSIAKAYVDMLGGDIWLESKPEVGTTFYFTIPNIEKSFNFSEKTVSETAVVETELLKNLTVLVAEDDTIGKMYISELLNGYCKNLIFASDGPEALQLFINNREKIDIVLMDIKMPGMNGYQTTQKMKEINRHVFIIAQTAYALLGDREKAFASGCDYYLAKPFSKTQLLEAVKKFYY